ncbi:MAG: fumarylacetoacetate hydrolase family protein [Thermaerobacter sp.]|nr:fumarylacetoacetate hydrolase family protein [Thermaerobacter sp.]
MRWGTVQVQGQVSAAIWVHERIVTMSALNAQAGCGFPETLEEIIVRGDAPRIRAWIDAQGDLYRRVGVSSDGVRLRAPLSRPERIAGIGLNYRAHAADLAESPPEEPATFMKPISTLIGPDETIRLPVASDRTTAEAEVALVFGRGARDVAAEDWKQVIFGLVPVLDMTAEDILRRNPRFLTRAKGFDTFFSMGPWIVTPDEWPDLEDVRIETVVDGTVAASNTLDAMTYGLAELVQFITAGCTLAPTAVLTTGTPGAAVIRPGMVAEARVAAIGTLKNPVGH